MTTCRTLAIVTVVSLMFYVTSSWTNVCLIRAVSTRVSTLSTRTTVAHKSTYVYRIRAFVAAVPVKMSTHAAVKQASLALIVTWTSMNVTRTRA